MGRCTVASVDGVSVAEKGVLQPIVVRPVDGGYEVVAGERRYRAAQAAGLTTVPAVVRDLSDRETLEIAIIENLQREDLSPLDEAMLFERMTSKHGYSLRKLAQKLGKDKGYIENRLRLAGAPTEIKTSTTAGRKPSIESIAATPTTR